MSSCRQEVFLLLRFCICIPAFQGIWYMQEDDTVSSYASATISSPCSYASTNLKKLLGYPYPRPRSVRTQVRSLMASIVESLNHTGSTSFLIGVENSIFFEKQSEKSLIACSANFYLPNWKNVEYNF